MHETDDVLGKLLDICRRDHAAWINGDPSGYALPDDATLMGGFGGSTPGGQTTDQRQRTANSIWVSGSGEVEMIDGGCSDGIAWLVMIERAAVLFTGRTHPVRWDLRVTELFRRRDESWQRFHRHADPLVDVHSLDEILKLLP